MPSGLTVDIYDGKDISLRDFLMRVGRGMGFAIMQRDADPDEPVKRVEPSTSHYDESQAKAEARIEWLRSLSHEELVNEARRAFETAHAEWAAGKAKKRDLKARYEAMLAQVEAWEPDPLVAGAKEYAIQQLRESMNFDCGTLDDEDRYPEPVKKLATVWLGEEIAEAGRSIEYAEKNRAEELERTVDRNRYIDAFYASLPPEPAALSRSHTPTENS